MSICISAPSLAHVRSPVFLVPCHLCNWRHVCRDVAYRLVRLFFLLIRYTKFRIVAFHRNVVKQAGPSNPDDDVYIGRSEVAMWMRVVSSWLCMLLYMWSLLAPVLLPDRYVFRFPLVKDMNVEIMCRFDDY